MSLACVPSARAADTGANAELSYGIPRADSDREIRLLEGAHVSWVRMNVGWDGVEPTSRGRHDERLLGDFDHAVSCLHRVGIGVVMPVADGVPFWASGDARKRTVHGAHRWNVHYRPRRFADYARFFSWVVRRYSRLGVHVYEVWNEPNIARFWPRDPTPAPSPRCSARRIRLSSAPIPPPPSCSVGSPRTTTSSYAGSTPTAEDAPSTRLATTSIPTAIRRAARTRPPARARAIRCAAWRMHHVMEAAGDGQKPVWITEFGWSTTTSAQGVSEMQQASYLKTALDRFASYPWLKAALVYQLRNVPFLHDRPEDWEANLGLVRTNFSPKPAYGALADYATTNWLLGGRGGTLGAALP